MAWIRQLASGLWQATVYTPTGERVTDTHKSKPIITAWANDLEGKKMSGTFIDPRLGRRKVGQIWDEYAADRRLEMASHKRDRSHWNAWVGPRWADVEVGPIRKPDITAWVVGLERAGVGGWTVVAALNVLRSMLEIAVDLGLIAHNPSTGVKAAPPAPHVDRVLDEWEDEILLKNLDTRFPGVPAARLFVETLIYTGLRYEELAALDSGYLVRRQRLISVQNVMEKDGTIRSYPKSTAGVRLVPVDDDLWPRLAEQAGLVGSGSLLFTAPGGGPLLYDNWLKRVWNKGLIEQREMADWEIEQWKSERRAAGLRPWKANWVHESPLLDEPRLTPHDCRHTFGTRCADAGMTEHDIAALMGHAPGSGATRKYIHSRDARFDRARSAMAGIRRSRSKP